MPDSGNQDTIELILRWGYWQTTASTPPENGKGTGCPDVDNVKFLVAQRLHLITRFLLRWEKAL